MSIRTVPAEQRRRFRATPGASSCARHRAAPGGAPTAEDDEEDRGDAAADDAIGLVPESWDADKREIDVILSTGADVLRQDWWTGESWIERLSLDPAHVRLDFLNSGKAPWLRVHNSRSLDAVLGVIMPGSARIEGEDKRAEGGENTARLLVRVRLSDTPGDAEIVRKIGTGLIRGVSTGYDTAAEDVRKASADNALELRVATDWTPFEGSSVPLGADSAAGVRSRSNMPAPPARQEPTMPIATNPATGGQLDEAAIRAKAAADERERAKAIRQAGTVTGATAAQVDALIDEGVSTDAARARLIELAAQRDAATRVATHQRGPEVVDDEADKRRRGIENALLHRAQPGRVQLTEEGRRFRGRSLLEIARMVLEGDGVRTDGMTPMELAGKALHQRGGGYLGTSDFPNILADVPRKVLRNAYAEAPSTYRAWANQVTLPDFRKKYAIQLGAAPNLEKIPESGEFKRGSIVDGAESYGLETYGKIIAVTRKLLINDDLGALTRLPQRMALAAARLENVIMYRLLTDNGNLADGVAIFHANHKNIVDVGSGGGFGDDTQLAKMRSLFTKQVDLDGATRLNLPMSIVLVPDKLFTSAEKLIKGQINPATTANVVSQFARNLELVTDPLLDDVSEKQWYTFANPAAADGFEFAFLEGEAGPAIDSEMDFDTDGMLLRVRHDFGGGCVDHRGVARNAGE